MTVLGAAKSATGRAELDSSSAGWRRACPAARRTDSRSSPPKSAATWPTPWGMSTRRPYQWGVAHVCTPRDPDLPARGRRVESGSSARQRNAGRELSPGGLELRHRFRLTRRWPSRTRSRPSMRGTGSWLSSASSVNAVDRTWLRGDGKVCLGSVDHTESISTFSPSCVARLRDGSKSRSVPADGDL